nr:VWA domain-containing protein [Pyrinomonadaceae bacterium]
VPVFVSNSRGGFISDLTQKDFAIRDNNRAVEISYFASGTERVGVVFALDASGSAREIAQQQAEAALSLLSQFGDRSRFACLRFADRPELVLPFTTQRNQVHQAFSFLALRNRRTAIFDAALTAVRLYDSDEARTQTERRIVILFSDGLDTASSTNFSTVIEAATKRGVSFYVLHLPVFAPLGGRLAPRPAVKGFRKLAEETGGRFFVIGDPEAALNPHAKPLLAPVFDAIAQDLRSQYMLGYYSHDDQAGHHSIDVNLVTSKRRRLRVNVLRKAYDINEEPTVK